MSQILSFVARYRKFLVAGAAGVAVVVNETVAGGTVRWIDVVAAILGALGVAAVPNAAASVATPSQTLPTPPPAA